MFSTAALLFLPLFTLVRGQQVRTAVSEVHPTLNWQKCTTTGGCVTQTTGKVVLDANWRWVHSTSNYDNCYTGNTWDATLCPDPATCTANCALDGADYSGTYGITTSGNALTLKYTTTSTSTNVGSRVYLMASETSYEMFKVLNQEFTFDVDTSNLPCGLNGALYFSEMDADGGMAKHPTNKAGARYGTGYCDSQCPRDLKFIDGEANLLGWTPSSTNSGTGKYGACCNEMDIWEANSISAAYTPHPCTPSGLYRCTGDECGTPDRYSGVCDPDGCDFNSYRMGDKTFYGKGMTVDTNSKFTVVTQFLTDDGTATGALTEIRRLYVQNGKVIQNSKVNIPGMAAYDSITDNYCTDQKTTFGDTNDFADHGGLSGISKSLKNGMVLVMSIWDDPAANMLWLDSNFPTTADPAKPGVARGSCSSTPGGPTLPVEGRVASVTYSNIRFGDIGSTYSGNPVTTTSKASTSTSTQSTATTTTTPATQAHYGQCAGIGYTGPSTCAAPYTCNYLNVYFSQCL